MSNPRKKVKLEPKPKLKPVEETEEDANNLNTALISFKNSLGISIGTLELPVTTTPKQMQEIVNKLIKEIDRELYEEQ